MEDILVPANAGLPGKQSLKSVAWISRKIRRGGVVGVSQVKSRNCFRRLEKLVLPSIFDTNLSSFMM